MKLLSKLKKKDLEGKIVLLRVDLNIENEYLKAKHSVLRITSILPTIEYLRKNGSKIVLISHRGRPVPLEREISNFQFPISNREEFTLKPFVKILSNLLKVDVEFVECDFKGNRLYAEKDVLKINSSKAGSIFLLENVRFFKGEEKNDKKFAQKLAALGDIYVNDSFAVDHRANASLVAITECLPSYAGLLLEKEMANLDKVMKNPKRPLTIILGGAKVSDKMGIVKRFIKEADRFVFAGGVANTMLVAEGLPIGDSIYEKNMISFAKDIKNKLSGRYIIPQDVVVKDRKILDIGKNSVSEIEKQVMKSKTIIWSGPLGLIENKRYAKGSQAIAEFVIKSKAFVVVGGGETSTLFAGKLKNKKNVFISTGGGAMLEYLSGLKLPAIKALEKGKKK